MVILDSEQHAQGVFKTLIQNELHSGALHTVVRKLCLLVGTERERDGAPENEEAEAQDEVNEQDGWPEWPVIDEDSSQMSSEDEFELDRENSKRNSTPLTWDAALAVLQRTHCLQSLTIRLPKDSTLDEEAMAALVRLRLLQKLDISAKIHLTQLWLILETAPLLQGLDITGLVTLDNAPPISPIQFESAKFHLSSISLSFCELVGDGLYQLVSGTQNTLHTLRLSNFSGSSRSTLRRALRNVGSNLRCLALQRVTFAVTIEDANLANLIDDLPTVCPLLEELQVASDKICSEDRFLPIVLPSLFLTQLELDYKLPAVSEQQILDMITNLPHGRMETFCLGSNLAHLATTKITRACHEMGIVVLGSTS